MLVGSDSKLAEIGASTHCYFSSEIEVVSPSGDWFYIESLASMRLHKRVCATFAFTIMLLTLISRSAR